MTPTLARSAETDPKEEPTVSDANASGRTGRPEPGVTQQGRGPEGDLNLGASSTTGNEDESGTLFVQDADDGSQLGAASGVGSLGTAGAPPTTPGGGDGTLEMDWGPSGPGAGVSGTEGQGQGQAGPTHPATGYDTTRTTGGFVQHPNDSALGTANTTDGAGVGQYNQEIAASVDAREAVTPAVSGVSPAGSGERGGGVAGGSGPRPIRDEGEASEDAYRSAT